jgi:hypothetical protein
MSFDYAKQNRDACKLENLQLRKKLHSYQNTALLQINTSGNKFTAANQTEFKLNSLIRLERWTQ